MEKTFDVALTYAGEDRPYVRQVANLLKLKGVKLYYDEYEFVRTLGKYLIDFLEDIYRNQTGFVVMFISKAYVHNERGYTNYERRIVLETAIRKPKEYIIPARFDDTEVPGLYTATAYIDLEKYSPKITANIILQKLNENGKSFKVDYEGILEPALIAWRFTRPKYANQILTRTPSSLLHQGRWHRKGAKIIYLGSSFCASMMETLTVTPSESIVEPIAAIPIKIPYEVSIKVIYESSLPKDWNSLHGSDECRDLVDTWLQSRESCILSVPSAVIRDERTFLVNPNHSDFNKLSALEPETFFFDTRLFFRL